MFYLVYAYGGYGICQKKTKSHRDRKKKGCCTHQTRVTGITRVKTPMRKKVFNTLQVIQILSETICKESFAQSET